MIQDSAEQNKYLLNKRLSRTSDTDNMSDIEKDSIIELAYRVDTNDFEAFYDPVANPIVHYGTEDRDTIIKGISAQFTPPNEDALKEIRAFQQMDKYDRFDAALAAGDVDLDQTNEEIINAHFNKLISADRTTHLRVLESSMSKEAVEFAKKFNYSGADDIDEEDLEGFSENDRSLISQHIRAAIPDQGGVIGYGADKISEFAGSIISNVGAGARIIKDGVSDTAMNLVGENHPYADGAKKVFDFAAKAITNPSSILLNSDSIGQYSKASLYEKVALKAQDLGVDINDVFNSHGFVDEEHEENLLKFFSKDDLSKANEFRREVTFQKARRAILSINPDTYKDLGSIGEWVVDNTVTLADIGVQLAVAGTTGGIGAGAYMFTRSAGERYERLVYDHGELPGNAFRSAVMVGTAVTAMNMLQLRHASAIGGKVGAKGFVESVGKLSSGELAKKIFKEKATIGAIAHGLTTSSLVVIEETLEGVADKLGDIYLRENGGYGEYSKESLADHTLNTLIENIRSMTIYAGAAGASKGAKFRKQARRDVKLGQIKMDERMVDNLANVDTFTTADISTKGYADLRSYREAGNKDGIAATLKNEGFTEEEVESIIEDEEVFDSFMSMIDDSDSAEYIRDLAGDAAESGRSIRNKKTEPEKVTEEKVEEPQPEIPEILKNLADIADVKKVADGKYSFTGAKGAELNIDLTGLPEGANQTARGMWSRSGNTIYLNPKSGDNSILTHEVVHFMRDSGVIDDNSWAKLSEMADSYKTSERVAKGYEDQNLDTEGMEQEKVAHMLQDWAENGVPADQRTLFTKVMDFIKSLIGMKAAVSGDKAAADLFKSIQSGQFINSETKDSPEGNDQVRYSTDAPGFAQWSEGGEVIESSDIGSHKFVEGKTSILKVYHGTTHDFNEFRGEEGSQEGHFGAVNYFTSSESDADQNYAGVGPDLQIRIETRAEQLESEFETIEALAEEFDIPADIDITNEDLTVTELAEAIADQELNGGNAETKNVYVKTKNPAIIGGQNQYIEMSELDESSLDEAWEEIKDEEGYDDSEREDYEGEIHDRAMVLEGFENPITEAVNELAEEYSFDPYIIIDSIHEEMTTTELDDVIRSAEIYAENSDGEMVSNGQISGEIFKALGYDSVILLNADKKFKSMSMESNTAHIHTFEDTKSSIKSVDENNGEYDQNNTDIRYALDLGLYEKNILDAGEIAAELSLVNRTGKVSMKFLEKNLSKLGNVTKSDLAKISEVANDIRRRSLAIAESTNDHLKNAGISVDHVRKITSARTRLANARRKQTTNPDLNMADDIKKAEENLDKANQEAAAAGFDQDAAIRAASALEQERRAYPKRFIRAAAAVKRAATQTERAKALDKLNALKEKKVKSENGFRAKIQDIRDRRKAEKDIVKANKSRENLANRAVKSKEINAAMSEFRAWFDSKLSENADFIPTIEDLSKFVFKTAGISKVIDKDTQVLARLNGLIEAVHSMNKTYNPKSKSSAAVAKELSKIQNRFKAGMSRKQVSSVITKVSNKINTIVTKDARKRRGDALTRLKALLEIKPKVRESIDKQRTTEEAQLLLKMAGEYITQMKKSDGKVFNPDTIGKVDFETAQEIMYQRPDGMSNEDFEDAKKVYLQGEAINLANIITNRMNAPIQDILDSTEHFTKLLTHGLAEMQEAAEQRVKESRAIVQYFHAGLKRMSTSDGTINALWIQAGNSTKNLVQLYETVIMKAPKELIIEDGVQYSRDEVMAMIRKNIGELETETLKKRTGARKALFSAMNRQFNKAERKGLRNLITESVGADWQNRLFNDLSRKKKSADFSEFDVRNEELSEMNVINLILALTSGEKFMSDSRRRQKAIERHGQEVGGKVNEEAKFNYIIKDGIYTFATEGDRQKYMDLMKSESRTVGLFQHENLGAMEAALSNEGRKVMASLREVSGMYQEELSEAVKERTGFHLQEIDNYYRLNIAKPKMGNNDLGRSGSANDSMLIHRQNHTQEIAADINPVSAFYESAGDSAQYIHSRAFADMNFAVLNSHRIAEASKHHSKDLVDEIRRRSRLSISGKPDADNEMLTSVPAAWARSFTAHTALWGNIGSMLKQLVGVFNLATEYGLIETLKGVTSPGIALNLKENFDVLSKSPIIYSRLVEQGFSEPAQAVAESLNGVSTVKEIASRAGFLGSGLSDALSSIMAGMIIIENNRKKPQFKGKSTAEIYAAVEHEIHAMIEMTQQASTSASSYRAGLTTSKNAVTKTFTQFMTDSLQKSGRLLTDWEATYHLLKEGEYKEAGQKAAALFIKNHLIQPIAWEVAGEIVKSMMGEDEVWDEEFLYGVIPSILAGPLSSLFVVGGILEGGVSVILDAAGVPQKFKFVSSGPPIAGITRTFSSIAKAGVSTVVFPFSEMDFDELMVEYHRMLKSTIRPYGIAAKIHKNYSE